MSERYQVRVSKDYLVFCAGHFISYDGDKCERLHGLQRLFRLHLADVAWHTLRVGQVPQHASSR